MAKSMLETIAPIALGVGAMALTGGAAAPALAGAEGAAAGAAGAGAAGATGAGLGGAFGSADMIAAGAGGGLLGGTGAATGAGVGAANAVPGTTESMGLLDMGGGNFVNPEYFVGEGMGMPMYAGSPDAPFMERAGNVLGSMGDQFQGFDPMKAARMMNMGGQQQPQQVSRSPAIQRPQSQPATEVQSLYSQPISGGLQLTDEQKAMLRQRMMGGQYGGLIG